MDNQTSQGSLTGFQRLLEAGLIFSAAVSIFLLLALVSFDPTDPSWSQTGNLNQIRNHMGAVGAWSADVMLFGLGWISYGVPVVIICVGWLLFKRIHRLLEIDYLTLGLRLIGSLLVLLASTGITSINFDDLYHFSSGGVVGDVIRDSMLPFFGYTGTTLFLLAALFTGITLFTGISWLNVIDKVGAATWALISWFYDRYTLSSEQRAANKAEIAASQPLKPLETLEPSVSPQPAFQPNLSAHQEPQITISLQDVLIEEEPQYVDFEQLIDEPISFSTVDETPIDDDIASALEALQMTSNQQDEAEFEPTIVNHDIPPQSRPSKPSKPAPTNPPLTGFAAAMARANEDVGDFPTIELLEKAQKSKNPIDPADLERISRMVEAKLLDFNIIAAVVGVFPGPVITRFELDLAPGIKVSKITGLSKDLARALSAMSVRVVEIIPGKSVIGLELPNKHREIVRLSEVITCNAFVNSDSPLTMVLGSDISGLPVTVDLGKMPHLLVAGTTGSGKSVGVNTMIISLLYKATPEDVRMIMIDPKMLELSVYEGIPHLLTGVVTDMKDAANSLRWCVGEMERRYKLMSALGVRNLKGFNVKVLEAIEQGRPLYDPLWKPSDSMEESAPQLEKLPYIVVIIDEFADMMMIVGKKVEELIARIAQKARAAGIHLILATQRPSVDVITGLIKANIPTRMSFQVSSRIDSRTILDQQGAESLLGMGDMLYLPPGTSVPTRIHGAFIDDHEVHAVVDNWKRRGKPNYIAEILSGDPSEDSLLPGEQMEGDDTESDEFYDPAVAFVCETRKVSVSSVQRKFRIGYNRAARIVEQMEMSGVVSSAASNGNREVLAAAPARVDY